MNQLVINGTPETLLPIINYLKKIDGFVMAVDVNHTLTYVYFKNLAHFCVMADPDTIQAMLNYLYDRKGFIFAERKSPEKIRVIFNHFEEAMATRIDISTKFDIINI